RHQANDQRRYMSSFILAFLAAVIVFCTYLMVDMYMAEKRRKESIRSRIAPDGSIVDIDSGDVGLEEGPSNLNGEPSPRAQTLLKLLHLLGVNTDEAIRNLELSFAHAGINSPDGPIYYLFFQRIGALVLLMLSLILFMNAMHSDNKLLMYCLAIMVAIAAL